MTETNELLDAVDALTKPTTERITQDTYETTIGADGRPKTDDDGNPVREKVGTRTVTVTHDPLLVRLADAITSTISRQGGGGTEKHARNILDSDALHEFMKITSTITDWCAIVKIRATRDATRDLRRWYAARLALNTETDEFYINQLHHWARIIRAKLNTPRSWEVKDPCPTCHHTTWIDTIEDNGHSTDMERNRPVIVEYWPDSTDVLATAKATCRRCGTEWRGSRALRELRFDIDARDTAEETTTV